MKHVTVHYDPEAYSSFPHAVLLERNKITVAYREATGVTLSQLKLGVVTHQDPDSRIVTILSEDGGETWLENSRRVCYEGKLAVNDPALLALPSGDLLMRLALWQVLPSRKRHQLTAPLAAHWPRSQLVGAMKGTAFIRSSDQGESWSGLHWLGLPGLEKAMSREAPIVLADGTLLLSVYEGYPDHVERSWVVRSWDGGQTWGDPVLVASDPAGTPPYRAGISYNETALVERPDGSLLGLVRADSGFHTEEGDLIPVGGVGELVRVESFDSGMTWSKPQPSGIWGQPAHLLYLNSGNLLCTYGYRRRPYGVRAVLSNDHGCTWTAGNLVLRHDAAGWDVGYPCSVQREDGTIVTLYYFHGDDGVRHIAATLWCEEEALSR